MTAVLRLRPIAAATLCAGLLALLCTASVHAHEIGTTRVSILLSEGRTYDVELVPDAAALVDKLSASAGSSSPLEIDARLLESLLASFDETFRQRLNIAFDGSDVRPAITYSVGRGNDA